jgi:ABC-2 type transport system permease protein
MMTSEFSAYYDNPEILDIMNAMPESLMKAFSMDSANLTTAVGYVSVVSLYFYLMASVFAILLGTNIISKEERDKTAEYLMVMPISRERIILSKIMASLINCLILILVVISATIISMRPYALDALFYDFMWLMTQSMFFSMMLFLSIGMLLASILRRYKSSGKISASLLVFLYFLSILTTLSDKIEFLKIFTPFKYFEAKDLIANGHLDLTYVIISLCVIIASFVGTFYIYPRRDLHL